MKEWGPEAEVPERLWKETASKIKSYGEINCDEHTCAWMKKMDQSLDLIGGCKSYLNDGGRQTLTL